MPSHPFPNRPLGALLVREPYGPAVAEALREIDQTFPGSIAAVDQLAEARGRATLRLGLELACQSQHAANIELGRAVILAMPIPWVVARIVEVARAALPLRDAWEFRRFLEVLSMLDLALLQSFAAEPLTSTDPELREALEDALAWTLRLDGD
jgi:hypothetical protein